MILQVKSLELAYLDNAKNISCIKPGEYTAVRYNSAKHGVCYHLKDVPGRSAILIHVGNYAAMVRDLAVAKHNLNIFNRIYQVVLKAIKRNAKKDSNMKSSGKAPDTQGCILVGLRFEDINNDSYLDVVDSTKAMDAMRAILPDKFQLIIR